MTTTAIRCPSRGGEAMRKVRADLRETMNGHPYCGEQLYDQEAMRRIEAVLPVLERPAKRTA